MKQFLLLLVVFPTTLSWLHIFLWKCICEFWLKPIPIISRDDGEMEINHKSFQFKSVLIAILLGCNDSFRNKLQNHLLHFLFRRFNFPEFLIDRQLSEVWFETSVHHCNFLESFLHCSIESTFLISGLSFVLPYLGLINLHLFKLT